MRGEHVGVVSPRPDYDARRELPPLPVLLVQSGPESMHFVPQCPVVALVDDRAVLTGQLGFLRDLPLAVGLGVEELGVHPHAFALRAPIEGISHKAPPRRL